MILRKRGRHLRKNTRMLLTQIERKIERQKLSQNPMWPLLLKDNKKWFYNCINNTKEDQGKSLFFIGCGGKRITNNEEKDEVPNAFLASFFNSKTSYPQHKPELVHRNIQQNGSSVTQGEIVAC